LFINDHSNLILQRLKELKIKTAVLTLTFISALILPFSLFAISQAKATNGYGSWSPIKNPGYAIITNYFGKNVPLGTSVIATAGTTDLTVYKIEFKWHDASNNTIFDVYVNVLGPLTTPTVPPNVPQQVINWANDNPGIQYLYAQNAQIPSSVGDWGIQAFYYAPDGSIQGQGSDIVAIKATSFNVIPEIPIIGTAGAAVAMLLGLGFFMTKRRKQN
jgi:hypothetical protein